jgi:hypothetical protein
MMANVIEIFSFAACLSLIVMWSLDLLASFYQRFKQFNSNKIIVLSEKNRCIAMLCICYIDDTND